MALDAKKHATLAAGENPTRAAIAAAIFSIDDIVTVANGTEAAQVAAAVAAAGQVLATDPVFVARADARGLHRIEYSYDGTVWLPFSGVLPFASTGTRDTWTASNSAYLTAGDKCRVGAVEYNWSGSAWEGGWTALTLLAGWVDFGTYQTARYAKIGGLVFMQGLIKNGTVTAGTVIATLPVGFRPPAHLTFAVTGAGGAVGIDVLANGNVVIGTGVSATNLSITIPPFPTA